MCPGWRWAQQRCAVVSGDYASTEPPPPIFQALLVVPVGVGFLDGAGGVAGCLPPVAHRANPRPGTQPVVAGARASTLARPAFWTPIGSALLRSHPSA